LREVDGQRGEMEVLRRGMRTGLGELEAAVESSRTVQVQGIREWSEEVVPMLR
jgi:hypothetical protein